jgi:hypothetical protein
MSVIGSIMDELAFIASSQISGLSTERGLRVPESLQKHEYPHLFIYDPSESVQVLDHQQESVETRITLLFAFIDETQEAVLSHIESFREGLRVDANLSGVVAHAYLSDFAIEESPETGRRIALAIVTTTRERF